MIVALGNDHAGYPLKDGVLQILRSLGVQVIDHGSYDAEPVDFPDIARLVCDSVLTGQAQRGIMVCGTGVGASIAANKIPGIRAAVCHDIYSAHQCVEHDDVNVMCLGAQIVGPTVAAAYIETFLKAEFSTEEHFRRRVAKLAELERANYNPR
ncbi:ribose 5-phosphate isomerase [Gordoniibacillus kamchatkensis]|uniref:Ribose 5-phosphate isomerase n=1 Tax=Gordoniibacillus kamchatkensis TaxID=1590651 RepID=A0ABR5AEK1_9BACL|nr:ribose 5-phosphate isomerase B [Paenibacillus sp. VKM B-2647]KIL39093.1 ribose 5-phosphate isomerase [Paenibacillus sp. VKM B-2647]